MKRTVQLPIEQPDRETYLLLRKLACQAAEWGNRTLAGQYIAKTAKLDAALKKSLDAQLWADSREELSGWVRGAMAQKCKAVWTRSGKLILRGSERLACFTGSSLSIAADQTNNRGVLYERDGDDYVLACRFQPAKTHEPVRLKLALDSTRARKDLFIREAVEAIWTGAWKPGTLTLKFDRTTGKISALIAYTKPDVPALAGTTGATLGPLDEHGRLFLRFDQGGAVDFSDYVHRIRERKVHHAGIVTRLRHGAGRKGRSGRYAAHRRKLGTLRGFEEYAEAQLHDLSIRVVRACRERGIAQLTVAGINDGEWPADKLKHMLAYKCEDNGIAYSDAEEATPAALRAKAATVRKRSQKVRRAKEGLKAVAEVVGL